MPRDFERGLAYAELKAHLERARKRQDAAAVRAYGEIIAPIDAKLAEVYRLFHPNPHETTAIGPEAAYRMLCQTSREVGSGGQSRARRMALAVRRANVNKLTHESRFQANELTPRLTAAPSRSSPAGGCDSQLLDALLWAEARVAYVIALGAFGKDAAAEEAAAARYFYFERMIQVKHAGYHPGNVSEAIIGELVAAGLATRSEQFNDAHTFLMQAMTGQSSQRENVPLHEALQILKITHWPVNDAPGLRGITGGSVPQPKVPKRGKHRNTDLDDGKWVVAYRALKAEHQAARENGNSPLMAACDAAIQAIDSQVIVGYRLHVPVGSQLNAPGTETAYCAVRRAWFDGTPHATRGGRRNAIGQIFGAVQRIGHTALTELFAPTPQSARPCTASASAGVQQCIGIGRCSTIVRPGYPDQGGSMVKPES